MADDAEGARTAALDAVRLIALPGNAEGPRKLTFVETPSSCPFPVRRVYWLHDLDEGEVRGRHAHKALRQLLVAVSGAFDIELDDGFAKRRYHLDTPTIALLLPAMIWREIRATRPHSTLVALVSAPFDESDYIRSHPEFVRLARSPA